ncbi:MAG: hypothetical protein RL727_1347 [Pseudomonadota bacterium]
METKLAPEFINTADGIEAKRILGKCVHCGFCTATCPTYQLLGDELDGPRGRIYLIKQMAEGQAPTEKTRTHLDRCLTCRNCESTCPSGVEYGKLVDIGRKWAEEKTAPRPIGQKLIRWLLKEGLTNKPLFDSAMQIGRIMRPLMPASIARKVPQGLPEYHRAYLSVTDRLKNIPAKWCCSMGAFNPACCQTSTMPRSVYSMHLVFN